MVRKVIDLECLLPADESGKPRQYHEQASHRIGYGDPELLEPRPGYGFANYKNIFRKRVDGALGEGAAKPAAKLKGQSIKEFVKELDAEGAEVSVLGRVDNHVLADVVAEFPKRFFALASISPFDGMKGVREFEYLVKERKLNGLRVAALYNNLAASDRRYYPLYAKCVELDVPVRIYSTMNYANDRPYDLGHPRHLDQIAMDFPELRIDAALSGWPWVQDLVGLMRRHPNLYCDTSAHHPAYFGVAGSGWEMFMQFGNTLLQDKIMVGFSKDSFGLTIPQSVAIYEKLPLKDKVIEKWLYGNAKEFLALLIQAVGLQELRDNVRVYFPQSFDHPPQVRSTVRIRYGNGRLSSARVVAITDRGDTLEIVEDGRDWFLHKDSQTDYWIVA